jgi:hypothetical protein
LGVYGTPTFIRSCRPTTAKTVPAGGYRLQIVKDGRTVRLYSKGGYDWTQRLAEALAAILCRARRSGRAALRAPWAGSVV